MAPTATDLLPKFFKNLIHMLIKMKILKNIANLKLII